MISVSEAKILTHKAQFAASGFAAMAESTIREAANKGESEVTMLIPLNVVNDMVEFLTSHGFEEVVITGAITGAMISVAW